MNLNTKTILVIGAVLIAIVIGSFFLMAQYHSGHYWNGDGDYHHDHMMEFSSGWGWIMMLMMLLFWGLIVWALIWGIRSFSRSDSDRDNRPLEILKRRYASGEIDREEFESKKRDLQGG